MSEHHSSLGNSHSDSSNEATRRILVVDDEQMILDISRSILKKKGYQVDTASDGEKARSLIEDNSYDLVIADLWMPGTLSGMDLFRWTQESKPDMQDKIVFMTGDSDTDEVRSFLKETNRPCLPKPFGIPEYLQVIQRALGVTPQNSA